MARQYNVVFDNNRINAIPNEEFGFIELLGSITVYSKEDEKNSVNPTISDENWIAAIQTQSFAGELWIYRKQNNFSGKYDEEFSLLTKIPLALITGANSFAYKDLSAAIGAEVSYLFEYHCTIDTEACNKAIASALLFTDDIILTTKDLCLRVKYNQEVSGFKRNVVDVISPTLNGAYPQVRRNAKQEYHSFNISGLISIAIEESDIYDAQIVTFGDSVQKQTDGEIDTNIYKNSIFLPVSNSAEWAQSFGKIQTLYESNSITKTDYIALMERAYRQKVSDFLYSPTVKLFKSLQEGNFFVYLSNVQLNYEKTSNRILYSFSCLATEVEQATPENYYNRFSERVNVNE